MRSARAVVLSTGPPLTWLVVTEVLLAVTTVLLVVLLAVRAVLLAGMVVVLPVVVVLAPRPPGWDEVEEAEDEVVEEEPWMTRLNQCSAPGWARPGYGAVAVVRRPCRRSDPSSSEADDVSVLRWRERGGRITNSTHTNTHTHTHTHMACSVQAIVSHTMTMWLNIKGQYRSGDQTIITILQATLGHPLPV